MKKFVFALAVVCLTASFSEAKCSGRRTPVRTAISYLFGGHQQSQTTTTTTTVRTKGATCTATSCPPATQAPAPVPVPAAKK